MLLSILGGLSLGLGAGEMIGSALVATVGISEATVGAITLGGGAVGAVAGAAEAAGDNN